MTTSTLTLADFLLTRIAEDEAADPRHGFLLNVEHHEVGCDLISAHSDYGPSCDCTGPARWLAECEAKRRIVETLTNRIAANKGLVFDPHPTAGYERHHGFVDGLTTTTEDVLRLLALPYADHPDYRDEWRP